MVALGIVLIVLGIGLIIGEFFTGTYLLFGLGVLFIIIGLVILTTSGSSRFQVDWWLVSVILAIVTGILVFAVLRIRNTYHHKVTTGTEDLKGKTAVVKEPLNPEGTVIYQGELWNAISNSGKIQIGEEVIITGVDGLMLSVIKKKRTENT
jgi:membrane-bound ClpP family serine protease